MIVKYKLLGLMVIFLIISSITPLSSAINISEQKTLEGFVISSLPPVNDELVEYFKAHNPDMNLMTLMAVYNAIMVQLTDEPGDVNPDIDDVNKQPKLKLTVFINYKTGNNSVIYKNRYTAKDLYQHSPGMKNFVDTVDNKIQHLSTMSNPELLKLCFVDDSERKAMEILNAADTPKLTYLLDGSVDCLNLDDLSSNQLLVGDQVKEKARKFFSKVCELNTKYDAGLTTDLENETIKLVDEASQYDPDYNVTDSTGFIKLLDSYLGIDQKSMQIRTTIISLGTSGTICTILGSALVGSVGYTKISGIGDYHNTLTQALNFKNFNVDKYIADEKNSMFQSYLIRLAMHGKVIVTLNKEGTTEYVDRNGNPVDPERVILDSEYADEYKAQISIMENQINDQNRKVETAIELGLDKGPSMAQRLNEIVGIVLMIIGLILIAVGIICLSIIGALVPVKDSLNTVRDTLYILVSKNSASYEIL
ncbi:MAG: hypothetical protein CfClM3_0445 [Methanobrevibacter sp. CfCl-M3]